MPIYDSIQEARNRGADDETILQKITEQNPAKAGVFQIARQRGANATIIVDKILETNAPASGFFAKEPTGSSPFQTGSIFTSPILPYEAGQGASGIAAKAAVNLPTSAARLGSALINPQTYVNLGRSLAGGIQSIPGIKQLYNRFATDKGQQTLEANRQAFQGLVTQLHDQFGSLENIKRSIAEDPAGTALAIRGILEGGAGILKGAGAEELAGQVKSAAGKVSPATLARPLLRGTRAGIVGTQDLITPIDENVKTILTQNPERAPFLETKLTTYFNQAQKAIKQTGAATPFDVAGKTVLKKALQVLDKQLTSAGELKTQALADVGGQSVAGIDAIHDSFRQMLKDRTGSIVTPKGNVRSAPGRISTFASTPGDASIALKLDKALRLFKDNPAKATLQRVNDLVDKMQDVVYKKSQPGAEPINTQLQGIVKNTLGKLNSAAKETGGADYQGANQSYSDTIDLRNKLNRLLGADAKYAGALMKKVFSPQDVGVKDLFQKIQDQTGVPIFEDATLSKFAMDTAGDPRARSMLENISLSKRGLTAMILNYLREKVTNPEATARRLIRASQPRSK